MKKNPMKSLSVRLPLAIAAGIAVVAAVIVALVCAVDARANRRAVLLLALILLGVAAATFLIGRWIVRRHVTRPIEALSECVRAFSYDTEADLRRNLERLDRVEVSAGDEIEAVYRMVRSIARDSAAAMASQAQALQAARDGSEASDGAAPESHRDGLTGVGGAAAYRREARRLAEDIAGGGAEFALVLIDLNNLKRINETYGSEKGDLYLKNGCRLICNVFSHSPVFRVGGDEFVVVLRNVDFVSREVLFQRFQQGMRSDPYLDEWQRVSAAMGCAIYDAGTDADVDSVYARAERAMYANKAAMKKA